VKNFAVHQQAIDEDPFYRGEPPLAELLADPVIKAVMSSDGVTPQQIAGLLAALRIST
jgi:hypothetical protein